MDNYGHGEKLQLTHGGPGPSASSSSPLHTTSEGALTVDHPEHRAQPQMIHHDHSGSATTSTPSSSAMPLLNISDRPFIPDVRMRQNEQREVSVPVDGVSAPDPPPAYHLGWNEHHSSSSSAQPTRELMDK